MVSGWPSCCSLKSSLVRLLTICPCLSRTVARTLTTLTSEEKVAVGVSWAASVQPNGNAAAASKTVIRPTDLIRTGSGLFALAMNICISNEFNLRHLASVDRDRNVLLAGTAVAKILCRRGSRLKPQMQQRCQV